MRIEPLIGRIHLVEELARTQPARFRRRVMLWAVFGYVGLAGLFVLALGVVIGGLSLLATDPMRMLANMLPILGVGAVVVLLLLRVSWTPVPVPEGMEITEADAPRLFAEILALREQLDVPVLHRVVINDEANAAVQERYRSWVLPRHERTLVIGLPYLEGKTADELRATLAHEMAHLSRRHVRGQHWVYRLNRWWPALLESLDLSGRGKTLSARYARWYFDRFEPWAFVMSRHDEVEADQTAARLTSSRATADSLIRGRLLASVMNRQLWPMVAERNRNLSEPPNDLFLRLDEVLAAGSQGPEAERALRNALAEPTGYSDTHPCLRERLATVGDSPRVPPAGDSAARTWLGDDGRARLVERFGLFWAEHSRTTWTARYETACTNRARVDELRSQPQRGVRERMELVEYLADLDLEDELLSECERVLEVAPDEHGARTAMAYRLTHRDDPRGADLLESVLATSDEPEPHLHYRLAWFYARAGDEARARQHRERAEQQERALARMLELDEDDELGPPRLDEEQTRALRKAVSLEPKAFAWLVYKHIDALPSGGAHLLLLCARPRGVVATLGLKLGWLVDINDTRNDSAGMKRYLDHVASALPDAASGVRVVDGERALQRRVDGISGTRLVG